MYLERLLFLITGAFVFLCLGVALVIMATAPGRQAGAPPAPVQVVTQSSSIDKEAAQAKVEALIASAPDYASFFKRLRETFPAEYAAALDAYKNQAAEGKGAENVDAFVSEAVRLLRQSRGVLAAKAEAAPLGKVFEVQLAVMRATAAQDPRMCVGFLYGASDRDFARFAAQRRSLIADMALAQLEAVASGQEKKIERDAPTETDLKALEGALAARGLGKTEIDAILDGKMPNPPLDDARMCAAGQTYLETLRALPEETRLRIYGLAVELMARS
jgi:hypothetical protein